MRILDKEDREVENPDLNLGYLTPDRLLVQHHDATPEIQEETHWELLKQYDNGDKAEGLIIDVPYQPAREAWDEYEDIQRYTEYTEEELAERATASAEQARTAAAAAQMAPTMMMFAAAQTDITDEQAETMDALLPDWAADTAYKQGQMVRYNGLRWRVTAEVTSTAAKTPDKDAEHYESTTDADEHGVYEWSRPLGSQDAYSLGDKVTHNGKTWKSKVPGERTNVWEPGVYGWDIVEYEPAEPGKPGEGGGEEPETPTYPEFAQPHNSEDAYHKGDRVTYNGKVYESLIDANVWSPDASPQGWAQVTKAVA